MEAYVSTWENRCYENGIPDEVSSTLERSHRVPSYRALAIALLKNDLKLASLGFTGKHSKWADTLRSEKAKKETYQLDLF